MLVDAAVDDIASVPIERGLEEASFATECLVDTRCLQPGGQLQVSHRCGVVSVLTKTSHRSDDDLIKFNYPWTSHPTSVAIAKQRRNLELLMSYASWANPIEAHFGPLRQFVIANSDYRDDPALTRAIRKYVRWRNAHTSSARPAPSVAPAQLGRSGATQGTPAASSNGVTRSQHHAPCHAPWTRTIGFTTLYLARA